jgi:hypothetical protein
MENRPIGNKLADEYFFDADYRGVLRVDKNRKGDKPMIYFILQPIENASLIEGGDQGKG